MLYRDTMPSPIGELELVATDEGLHEIRLPLPRRHPPARARQEPGHPVLREVRKQLEEYFLGRRRDFDLPLDVEGSPFQRQIWDALREIPYGTTASYGDVAARVGRPGAARAVGGANSRNPVSIVVPCHRVVGATGALTGYAGPDERGIAIKRWLLDHEASTPDRGET